MNHNEEVPDFLGGLGDMLPADVLKKVNELLEQLHRKDKDHQGSPVFIYAPGSQYVDKQFIFDKVTWKHPAPPDGHPAPNRGGELPDVLATDKAMALWRKAQRAGIRGEQGRDAEQFSNLPRSAHCPAVAPAVASLIDHRPLRPDSRGNQPV